MGDSLGHALPGNLNAWECEVQQFDAPSRGEQAPDELEVAATGQSRLECEVPALANASLDLLPEETAGCDELAFWRERREASGDQVSVNEDRTWSNLRQVL